MLGDRADALQASGTQLEEIWVPFKPNSCATRVAPWHKLGQRILEDRLLDLNRYAAARSACVGHAIYETVGALGREIAAEFADFPTCAINLVPAIEYVIDIVCKFEQRQLAAWHLLRLGHVRFLDESDDELATPSNSIQSRMAAPKSPLRRVLISTTSTAR